MPQTPLLGTGTIPAIPVTSTSIGYDNTTSGSTATDAQSEFDRLEALIAALVSAGALIVTDGVLTINPARELDVPFGAAADLGAGAARLHFLTSWYGGQPDTVTDSSVSGSYDFDLSKGNWFDLTLTGNVTSSTISNPPPASGEFYIFIRQGGSGSYTFVFPTEFDWQAADGTATGSAPTLHTAVGAINVIGFAGVDGGTSFGAWDESGASLTVKDEGTPLATAATSIDFVGAGVTASGATGAKTITIPGFTLTSAAIAAFGFVGPLLISDTPSTPLVFADVLQNEAQNDLIYADV